MKKTVIINNPPPQNVINLAEVSDNQYFGVEIPERLGNEDLRNKGFIMQSSYQKGEYNLICPAGMTFHNTFSYVANPTLKGIIQECLATNQAKEVWPVYCFDTPKELFQWLLE